MAPTAENATIDGTGENIIVTKKSSTDTTKNLVISAHYDSAEESAGANDNGSGVAAVLELARILKDTEMPYDIKFILFRQSFFCSCNVKITIDMQKQKRYNKKD